MEAARLKHGRWNSAGFGFDLPGGSVRTSVSGVSRAVARSSEARSARTVQCSLGTRRFCLGTRISRREMTGGGGRATRLSTAASDGNGTSWREISPRRAQRPRHRRERLLVRAAAAVQPRPARVRRRRSSGRALMWSAPPGGPSRWKERRCRVGLPIEAAPPRLLHQPACPVQRERRQRRRRRFLDRPGVSLRGRFGGGTVRSARTDESCDLTYVAGDDDGQDLRQLSAQHEPHRLGAYSWGILQGQLAQCVPYFSHDCHPPGVVAVLHCLPGRGRSRACK